MKKRNRILRNFLIMLLILSLPFYYGSQSGQLYKAECFFKNNQPVLEDSIKVLESTLKNTVSNEDNFINLKKPSILPNNVEQIYWVRADGGNQAYVLHLGGFGIVPSTSYYGLYYVIKDTPCNLMEPQKHENLRQKNKSKRTKEIWTWQEENGDNSFYTERIAPHWFTYRETF